MESFRTLSHRQTGEFLKLLNGGRIGFDHKKHSLAHLHASVAHWIATGVYSAEFVEECAQQILAPALAPIPAPSAAPIPAPLPAAAAPVIPVFAPIPAPAAPAPAPEPEPEPLPAAAPPLTIAPVAQAVQRAHDIPSHGVRRVNAREVFADLPADVLAELPPALALLHYGHAEAPVIDSKYVYNGKTLRRVLIALSNARPTPVWLAGPKGTGKTEFAQQIAARFGRPFFRVGFNRATEPADILGDIGIVNQTTIWQDGPAMRAIRTAGAVLLFDEITYAAQGYLASLNPIMDRAPFRLPRTGEQIVTKPDVFIMAADNTFGHGDTSGEYNNRTPMSADTLDRFRVKVKMGYLPKDKEIDLLIATIAEDCGVKLKRSTATAIINVAHVARTKSERGELPGAPGLRACIAMAMMIVNGEPAADAYDCTITLSAPPESHEELRGIFAGHWPSADADVNTI